MEVIRREARRKDIVIGMRLKEISLLEERLKEISLLEGKADDHGKGFVRLQVFG